MGYIDDRIRQSSRFKVQSEFWYELMWWQQNNEKHSKSRSNKGGQVFILDKGEK